MAMEYLVMVIDDSEVLCEYICDLLEENGYGAVVAYNAREGLDICGKCRPDVILLDLGLPDMDGVDLLKAIRSFCTSQIIVLSARNTVNDKETTLDLGADDYVTKPFSNKELLARIRTAIRHDIGGRDRENNIYRYADLEIDLPKQQVTLCNEEIHLTPTEYRIVECLACKSGQCISNDAIINYVWGKTKDKHDTKALRVNLNSIRKKLNDSPSDPVYIFNEPCLGYKMPKNTK